jgi:CHASE2 domain-containing sensor protein
MTVVMKPAAWMVGASLASWVIVAAMVDGRTRVEVLLGMLGPLAVVSATWVLMARTYRQDPEALTSLMVAAFGFKLVFFGGYVAVMLGWLGLRPVPFVASFTSYFVGLYLIEALYLRRLFS